MDRFIIFAGAGISQESGLSTFRDTDGIWNQFNIDELCNYTKWLNATKNETDLRAQIFEFYNLRKVAIQQAQPNAAHFQVAQWQQRFGDKVIIITSNIDDLFEKAGCTNVLHVHGETTHMHCATCAKNWHIGDAPFDPEPRCPHCGSRYTKPNVVFFGERAPNYGSMFAHFHPKRRTRNDVLLYVGSSMTVLPPKLLFGDGKKDQKANWGHRIFVNKDRPSEPIPFDFTFYGLATEKLPEVDMLLTRLTYI